MLERRRRFQFCIERFQSLGRLFLQLCNSQAGSGGGGRCVGGPATAGRLPMGAARLAAARLRRFEVFGIGVRCCSVSSRRHAVSGSVPKARRRPFRCGRVPCRRTRLLVALERRGSGRLSDGERLHEPLGGRDEDLQDVETLLPRGRHDGPEERENPRALEVRKPPEIFILTFIIRRSRSARLLVKGTSKSVRKRSVSVLNFFSLSSRLWPGRCLRRPRVFDFVSNAGSPR